MPHSSDNLTQHHEEQLAGILGEFLETAEQSAAVSFLPSATRALRQLKDSLQQQTPAEAPLQPRTAKQTENSKTVASLATFFQKNINTPNIETVEVYIPLYRADGSNLQKWSELLKKGNLALRVAGCSVFSTEESVQKAINSKTTTNAQSNAYAVLAINPEEIKSIRNDVVTLKNNNAILNAETARFVHNGIHYSIHHNKGGQLVLIPKETAEAIEPKEQTVAMQPNM